MKILIDYSIRKREIIHVSDKEMEGYNFENNDDYLDFANEIMINHVTDPYIIIKTIIENCDLDEFEILEEP